MATYDEVLVTKTELARVEEAVAVARSALGIEPDAGTLLGDVRITAHGLNEARQERDRLQSSADELSLYITEHQKRSIGIRNEIGALPTPTDDMALDETTAIEQKRSELQEQMALEDRLVADAQVKINTIEIQRDVSTTDTVAFETQLSALLDQAQQITIDKKAAIETAEATIGIAHENTKSCGAAIAIDGVRVLCQREIGHHVDAYDRHKFVIVANGATDANAPKTDPAVHCAIVWNEPGTGA